MTIDIFTTDWKQARNKLDGWKPDEPEDNLFEGSVLCQTAEVEGVQVTRFCMCPQAPIAAQTPIAAQAPIGDQIATAAQTPTAAQAPIGDQIATAAQAPTAAQGPISPQSTIAAQTPTGPQTTKGLAGISKTFALCFEADWQTVDPDTVQLPLGLTWQQSRAGRFDFHFEMPAQMRAHGLGERFSDFNLRGSKHTLFATDNPNHNEHADMLYKSIPFLILADGAKYTGLFLDSPAPQRWDLDSEMTAQGKIELFTRRGFYFYLLETVQAAARSNSSETGGQIAGTKDTVSSAKSETPGSGKAETQPSALASLVGAFTRLTGRAPLPPLWSLGHQQCRWSYPDEDTIRELASQFRRRKIPCDTLVLDIDYMDDYRVFTYSHERFPLFPKLAAELARDNFKLITIVDPGVKKDEKYSVYRQGIARNLFCKTAKGEVFIEKVWPGLSAFPDFLNEETRLWWKDNLKFYTDHGIAGIWNDMNEPAMFNSQRPLPEPLVEMPEDDQQLFLQRGESGAVGHFEVRNLYGFLMSLATHEALAQYRPDERPFVLTRSASTGIQRYAAVWLGDNTSWFEHLQKSLPMLLNIGLSGVAFAGVDIGGFGGSTTPELLVRWYEIGIFYPFFRNHCALMGRAQEPFSFSEPVEKMVRHLIETRYRLLPYIQGLFREHAASGAPLMRPMAWHYSHDEIAATCEDQFMFGTDIMVAPVLRPNQTSRYVYFPEGRWYPFEGGDPVAGGQTHRIACPLGRVPAFVREGAIIPLADIMQSTADYADSAITFCAFGETARGKYFEDDGQSLKYKNGEYSAWELDVAGQNFQARNVHRGYVQGRRSYRLHAAGKLQDVTLQ